MGTFAPVMRFETLRTLLAMSAIHNWELQQMDIKGAYLNGKIVEELYMKQPTGFEDRTVRVCRLRRRIYGLQQAGNVWNHELNETMREFGYTRLRSDYCTYIRHNGDAFLIMIVWVDDIITIANNKAEIDRAEAEMKSKYTVKVIGEPTMLLGIHIARDHTKQMIKLSQSHYIR